MPEEIKAEFILDWKTVVAIGAAVAIMLLGFGGCCYLVSKGDAVIRNPPSSGTNQLQIPSMLSGNP